MAGKVSRSRCTLKETITLKYVDVFTREISLVADPLESCFYASGLHSEG